MLLKILLFEVLLISGGSKFTYPAPDAALSVGKQQNHSETREKAEIHRALYQDLPGDTFPLLQHLK